MTPQELETNQKFRYWYDYSTAQQASSMSVANYCKANSLSITVFYAYKRKIKKLICDDINSIGETSAVVTFVAVSENVQAGLSDSVFTTIGTLRIELDEGTNYQDVEKLLRSLIC
ncbi:IS66 family insertion sequence element accessory protein TnpA [Sharpea porci]|uniref:IS66 family insertion sequence element accessory protein TnpA n=1 Tax=Sharpea porci TaxID=2652286 RepID=UPI002A916A81|nr:hypothetical protein [Sharpea porci]MDY5278970.1 hypothetical protein [Sharpea porci]